MRHDLLAAGGDKVITESHLLGDKHRPSGGEAAVMKGIDRLMAEVANLRIKGLSRTGSGVA